MMTSLRYWGWLVPLGVFGAIAILTDIPPLILASAALASIAVMWLLLGRQDKRRRISTETDAGGANR